MVALGEASLSALIDEDPGAEELSEDVERLMNAIFDLDDEIKQQEILLLLSTLTGTELLENWRRNLVEPYASILPYWLDGTLEDAARYLEREFEATVPRFKVVKPEVRASQRTREVFKNLPQPLAVAADAQALPLAEGALDHAFFIAVLGEVPDPVQALREVRRVLRPGGRVTIIEYLPDPDYSFPSTMLRRAEQAGLHLRQRRNSFLGYTLELEK